MRRIFDKTKRDLFWEDYNNEPDPGIQAEMLFRWEPSESTVNKALSTQKIAS